MRSAVPLSRADVLFLAMDTGKCGVLDLNELRALVTPHPERDTLMKMLKHYIVSERSFEISKARFLQLYEDWQDDSLSEESSYCQCEKDDLNSVWRPKAQKPDPRPVADKENESILYLIRKMHLLASQRDYQNSSALSDS